MGMYLRGCHTGTRGVHRVALNKRIMTKPDERRNCTSASNAHADSLCPGRHNAQRGLPDVRSDDSDFGDKVHAALATGKDDGLDTQQLSVVESSREIEDKLVREAFGPDAAKATTTMEVRLWCLVPSGDRKFEHSAKPDKVVIFGNKGLVIERKSLPGDVPESSQNLQLRDQVVLVARTHKLDDVAAVVVQPLVTHSPQVCAYTKEDIDRAEREMWARVIRSNTDATRVAGEIQCKFCKAKNLCPDYAKWSQSMLPAPVSIFDVPVAEWSPEQCATFLERKAQAQRWLNDCEAQMKKRLTDDANAIPGWGLSPGDIKHKVNNPQELFNRFNALGGTLEQFMQCVGVTKKDLEAQVRAVTKMKGKSLNGAVEGLLKGITTAKQSQPSIERKK